MTCATATPYQDVHRRRLPGAGTCCSPLAGPLATSIISLPSLNAGFRVPMRLVPCGGRDGFCLPSTYDLRLLFAYGRFNLLLLFNYATTLLGMASAFASTWIALSRIAICATCLPTFWCCYYVLPTAATCCITHESGFGFAAIIFFRCHCIGLVIVFLVLYIPLCPLNPLISCLCFS